MKRRNYVCITGLFTLILLLFAEILHGQLPAEYQQRREAVLKNMAPNSVMILRGNPGGSEIGKFRQYNNIYYLTGINEPGVFLVLKSRDFAKKRRSRGAHIMNASTVLFIEPVNPRMADWDPEKLGIEGAQQKLGIRNVFASDQFQSYFESVLLGSPDVVYMDYERSFGLNEPLSKDEQLFIKAREKGVEFDVEPLSALLDVERRIKSEAEIALLRKAIEITAAAQNEAMRSIRPGMYEYQLQSIIEHVFTINGAQRPGFNSIVGSGRNSCILHWDENSKLMESGDLVVIDIGAEYNMYTGDITRTIPVNGTFSSRQREIYEIVLRANETAIDMIAPGISMSDVSRKTGDVLAEGLIAAGLIKDKSELRRYFFHGLGHPIGLQVHDVGGTGTLEPGMIITIEPGIYVREESLGVRIEDDVLVTENGHEVLSKNTPKAIEDVEKLLRQRGVDYSRYLIR